MRKTSILAAAILASLSSAALAQTSSAPTSNANAQNNTTQADPNRLADEHARQMGSARQADQSGVRQQVVSNLQQAGFTDIKVTPESFLVEAKDRSGNPVTMFIGPHSFAELKTVGVNANTQTNAANGNTSSTDNKPGGPFATVPPKDGLSSQVVGLNVYNNAKQDIGTIKDIAFNDKGIDGYILSVGGFLGLGNHYVAVRPSALNLTYDRANNKWRATMDTTADQLKAAPEFKYPNNT